MSIPDKDHIIEHLSNKYSCKLTTMARKQIMYEETKMGNALLYALRVLKYTKKVVVGSI